MSGMRERLGAAVELDALGFSGEDFADARLGSVRGRVRRRRAARSAGVGGASVLGVGAVVVAATHVPFSSLGLAGPGATSPSLVCSTATATPSPGFAPVIFTFTDPSDGSTAKVAVDANGGEVTSVMQPGGGSLVTLENGDQLLTLPNGTEATVGFVLAAVGLPEGADQNTLLGVAIFEGDVTTTSERGPTPTPVPTAVVTCLDSAPSLTASEVPSPQVSLAASPEPSRSDVAPAVSSPFECGYVLDSEVRTDPDVWISNSGYMNPVDIALAAGQTPPTVEDPDLWDPPMFPFAVAGWHKSEADHVTGGLDPRAIGGENWTATGVGVVQVKDGVVVAVRAADPATDEPVSHTVLHNDEVALYVAHGDFFMTCPGVTSLEGSESYAVAGNATYAADGSVTESTYVWRPVS